ncbi:GntR family transcriptional regulator [Streptomyces sp. NPDC056304]|uniref:GntR family transcriptional regulator n=1 Tax=Streptomyces sp. NPDC056304 TaxID=3345778 RepID=UPI0035DB6282
MTSRPQGPKRWSAQQIAEDLRRRMREGEFRETGQLPPTRELVERYNSSGETLRQAVLKLKTWGLVTSQQGKGVYIRAIDPVEWHIRSTESGNQRGMLVVDFDGWKASVESLGRVASQDPCVITVERAPEEVAHWLDLEPGAWAIARRTLRRCDGVPFQLADYWFPLDVAMNSPLMEEYDISMVDDVLADIGHPQIHRRHILRSWLPTDDEAKRLELEPDATNPIARHVVVGHGADRKPVCCLVTIAPGDRNVLIYDFDG